MGGWGDREAWGTKALGSLLIFQFLFFLLTLEHNIIHRHRCTCIHPHKVMLICVSFMFVLVLFIVIALDIIMIIVLPLLFLCYYRPYLIWLWYNVLSRMNIQGGPSFLTFKYPMHM